MRLGDCAVTKMEYQKKIYILQKNVGGFFAWLYEYIVNIDFSIFSFYVHGKNRMSTIDKTI